MSDSLLEWATPIIEQENKYRRRSWGWNIITLVVVVGAFVYFFYASTEPVVQVTWIVIMVIVSALLKNTALRSPDLSLPDRYSINLLRIRNLCNQIEQDRNTQEKKSGTMEEFDDAVADLTKRIDADLYKLRDNLAAFKTSETLIALRKYVLKFATAVKNPADANRIVGRSNGALVKVMSDEIMRTADAFHRFYEVGSLIELIKAPVERGTLSKLPEQKSRQSSKYVLKFFRAWYGLPVPLQILVFGVILIAGVWFMLPAILAPIAVDPIVRLEIIVPGLLVILAYFGRPFSVWLRATLFGE